MADFVYYTIIQWNICGPEATYGGALVNSESVDVYMEYICVKNTFVEAPSHGAALYVNYIHTGPNAAKRRYTASQRPHMPVLLGTRW